MRRKYKIWQLGDHRLMNGDATDSEAIATLLGTTKINALVTDPPYGVSYTENKIGLTTIKVKKDILNDNISSEPVYTAFSKAWLDPILPHFSKKNSLYIFVSEKMLFAFKNALDQCDINFSQLILWIKSQAVIGRKDYLPQHEIVIFAWFGTHAFRRSKDKSVIFYPKPSKSSLHPTMKPVPLIVRLILNSTNIGDTVYDPFGGSGTTLIACEQTKRKCFMAELDPEYCQTIIKRWEKVSGLKAKLL